MWLAISRSSRRLYRLTTTVSGHTVGIQAGPRITSFVYRNSDSGTCSMIPLAAVRGRLALPAAAVGGSRRPTQTCPTLPQRPSPHPAQTIPTRGTANAPVGTLSEAQAEPTEAKDFDEMPGPASLPFIGTLYKYLPFGEYSFKHPHESDMRRYAKYGPIVREEVFPGVNQVRLFDPEDIAAMFRNEGRYPNRMHLAGIKAHREQRGVSAGLANLNGEPWQRFRSQVQKKMMGRISAVTYIPAQEPIAEEFTERMRMLRDENGEIPDYLHELYKWAMESIGVVCFDSRLGTLDPDQPEDSEARRFIKAVNSAFMGIHKTTFLWELYSRLPKSKTIDQLYDDLDIIWDISRRHIDSALKRATDGEATLIPPEDSLLLTLLARPQLNEGEALSLIGDLFMAGVDTTAHTLAFNLNNLAMNPECQKRLHAEIDEFAPEGTPLTHDVIEQMKYLRAVTKESSRLTPTTSGTMRILEKDIVLSGYRIPAGTGLFCGNTVICALPKYYDNPEEFRPERWLRQGGRKPDSASKPGVGQRFSLLPFGHGPRMCIGRRFAEQEIWLGLIKILQQFSIEYHHEPIGQVTRLISMPDKPLRFSFVDRS